MGENRLMDADDSEEEIEKSKNDDENDNKTLKVNYEDGGKDLYSLKFDDKNEFIKKFGIMAIRKGKSMIPGYLKLMEGQYFKGNDGKLRKAVEFTENWEKLWFGFHYDREWETGRDLKYDSLGDVGKVINNLKFQLFCVK